MKNDYPECPVAGCDGKLDEEGIETSGRKKRRRYRFCSKCGYTEFLWWIGR